MRQAGYLQELLRHVLLPYKQRLRLCVLRTLSLSVALVRERTIPTELPPPVGEVSANFRG